MNGRASNDGKKVHLDYLLSTTAARFVMRCLSATVLRTISKESHTLTRVSYFSKYVVRVHAHGTIAGAILSSSIRPPPQVEIGTTLFLSLMCTHSRPSDEDPTADTCLTDWDALDSDCSSERAHAFDAGGVLQTPPERESSTPLTRSSLTERPKKNLKKRPAKRGYSSISPKDSVNVKLQKRGERTQRKSLTLLR